MLEHIRYKNSIKMILYDAVSTPVMHDATDTPPMTSESLFHVSAPPSFISPVKADTYNITRCSVSPFATNPLAHTADTTKKQGNLIQCLYPQTSKSTNATPQPTPVTQKTQLPIQSQSAVQAPSLTWDPSTPLPGVAVYT